MDAALSILGFEMRPGDSVTVESRELFRDWLMPVVVIDPFGELKVYGTAVCIGLGTFVTARHVVEDLLGVERQGNDAGVWVAWDTGTEGGASGRFRGLMLPVVRARGHERVDLAILTTTMPPETVGRHKTVAWVLRMLAVGELVVLLGYPNGQAKADITVDGPTDVELEHPLRLSLGMVTQHFEQWASEPFDPWGDPKPLNPRGWPGFGTDAPMPPAMSGGAVFDRSNGLVGLCSSSDEPGPEHPEWAGFVNMTGYLLDMDVDVHGLDGALVPTPVPDVIDAGQVDVVTDRATFHLDENHKASYVFPSSK